MEKTVVKIKLPKLHDGQKKIRNSKAKYKVICCGRQFGKTYYAVSHLIEEALLKENGRFWYVAPTYRQGKEIAWKILAEAVRKLPEALVHKVNEADLFVRIGNNSEISIKGADNPDSLRGVALHGVVLDEYAFMRENVFTEIILPMFNTTDGWAIFISTPKGFNHFYDLYMQGKSRDGWESFHFTSYDNPYASPAVIEEAKLSMSPDRFAQEYMAEFRKAEGLVYKEFSRDKHVFSNDLIENRQWTEVIAGIDFGYNNPTAIVVIGKDFDSRFFVLEEWYKSRKTTPEIIEQCKMLSAKYPITKFYPDPAAAAAIEECKRAGLHFVDDVSKDVAKGIDSIRSLLVHNRLYVSLQCPNLISEFETYAYPDKEDLRGVSNRNEPEKPIKENDHALDALRYALFNNEPVRSQSNIDFGLYSSTYS